MLHSYLKYSKDTVIHMVKSGSINKTKQDLG